MIQKRIFIFVFAALFLSANTYKDAPKVASNPAKTKDTTNQTVEPVCNTPKITGDFKALADSFYKQIFTDENRMNSKVFHHGFKGYVYLLNQGALKRTDTMTIIDYSLSANTKRLWVLDLRNLKVLYHELVAHGKNSGNVYASSFSNTSNSYKTSLGFFITGDIYKGKHEVSLRLFGMERKFNGNAFDRGIVIHGADYVSESFIAGNQRLGRSQGCPAVSQNVVNGLVSAIGNGTCLFAYYPNKTYLKSSHILKS